MKKIIAAFLMLFVIIGLCACVNDGSDLNDSTSLDSTKADSTEKFEAEAEETNSEASGSQYVVTVVDSDNNPISGAILQMCKLGDDGSCTPGNPSDAEGKVTFSLPEDEYKVSFIVMPAGYTYSGEDENFYFEDDATELTITLKKAD